MQINAEEVTYKKKIGDLEGDPIIEVGLKGGLHLIFLTKGGKIETLGAGPHRAVARFIAKKKNDKINWTELSKSDWIDESNYLHLVPKYEAITAAFRASNK